MSKYPYVKYQSSKLWAVINKAIEELVNNKDIEEKTQRKYIIGYLCEKIEEFIEPPKK